MQSFDPLLALIGANPQIKKTLEEYDNLLRDKTALVGEIERNQRALGEIESKITQITIDFQERFTIVRKEPKPGKKGKTPEPRPQEEARPPRKLTFAQWMASLRQAFKVSAPMYAETAPAQDAEFWQEQFDAGRKPSEAAAAWSSRKSPAKKSPHPLSEPNPDGPFFPPSKLGITEADLDLGLSNGMRYPDEGQHCKIGIPLNTNKGLFAVICCNERTSHTVYHLHPVDPEVEGKKRIQWPDRLKQYPKLAPEDVPLHGLFVVDDKGHEYLMGADEARIFVEVPKRKGGKA